MPADHRGGLDDQEHLWEAPTVDASEHCEDGTVGIDEHRSVDPPLQHHDLTPEARILASRSSPEAKSQQNRMITSRAREANRTMAGARY